MKWFSSPKEGDIRVKKGFLFLPMSITDAEYRKEWRWLEAVTYEQEYKRRSRWSFFFGDLPAKYWWENIRWIDK